MNAKFFDKEEKLTRRIKDEPEEASVAEEEEEEEEKKTEMKLKKELFKCELELKIQRR